MFGFFNRAKRADPVPEAMKNVDVRNRASVTLGDLVKDKVTGFTGIASVRSTEIDGTVFICIQPRELQNGVPLEPFEFDIERIEVVSPGMAKTNDKARQAEDTTKIGAVYRDRVSGFVGTCVNRMEFLGGCTRLTLRGKVDKDNKRPDPVMVAVESAELVDPAPAVEAEKRKTPTGGPGKHEQALVARLMR